MPSEKRWLRYPDSADFRRFCGLGVERARTEFGRADPRAKTRAKVRQARSITAILATLTVLGVLIAIPLHSEPITVDDPAGPRRSEMKVSAKELGAAFNSNSIEAQSLYGKRSLRVSGTLAEEQLYLMNESFVLLGRSSEDVDIQAEIADAGRQKAAKLLKGEEVELVCENVSQIVGPPVLENCGIPS